MTQLADLKPSSVTVNHSILA